MTTFATIGSGNIGATVARLAAGAGYDVVVSNSRGPETLSDLVAELGPNARAASAAEAAAAGDIVLATVPLKAYPQLPAEPLAGKVVLDTMNYYPDRDGQIAELDDKQTTTSELVAGHLGGARVVKVFNNIYSESLRDLARPAGAPDRSALIIYGDDAEAKRQATEFLDRIGYDTHDAGPLADSWRVERDQPAYTWPYAVGADMTKARPAQADELRDALARATR